jgi:hypothetical protein
VSSRLAAGSSTGLLETAGALPFRMDSVLRYRGIAPFGDVARDPASKIGYTSMRGYYWSLLMGVRYPHESLLERDAMLLHDLDPTVRTMQAQPQTYLLRLDGRRVKYTPDLRVGFAGSTFVDLEIKRAERIAALTELRKEQMRRACAGEGRLHAFLDEAGIYPEPLWGNSVSARASAAHLTDDALLDAGRALLRTGLPTTTRELLLAMSGRTRLQSVLGLVALRILTLPLAADITAATIVSRGENW